MAALSWTEKTVGWQAAATTVGTQDFVDRNDNLAPQEAIYYTSYAKVDPAILLLGAKLPASSGGTYAIDACVGGIYSGVFSPTEAAGVSCVYAMFVAFVVYREMTLTELFQIAARTFLLTAMFFIIVSVAGMFGWLLTIALYFLELLVALLQAYVFTILSAVFIGQSMHPEH